MLGEGSATALKYLERVNPFPGASDLWKCCNSPGPAAFLGVSGLTRSRRAGPGFTKLRLKTRGSRECRGEVRRKAMSCRGARTRCSSEVLPTVQGEDNSSVSGLALAEISKHNLKKHYHNCMFAGKGKKNQKKKDKTSRERKFISKHLRECYKQ